MNGFPRRTNVNGWTPAEAAIARAVQAVEALPADIRLTHAVMLLREAQIKVADYVDATLASTTTEEGK